MTTPENAAVTVATGGLGAVRCVTAAVVRGGLSAYFATGAGKALKEKYPQIKDAVKAKDWQGALELGGGAYDYEPNEGAILETLLPRNITVQIFSAMLENQAGFFAVQMSAMDNATRNAGDMINGLTITYNRTRQAQITKELIEIISGAEAL